MYRILVSDELEDTGLELLRASGHDVVCLDPKERARLPEVLGEFDALVVRSATKVTAELLSRGTRLRVVGRAGIGVDNVDVDAATARGILVVNAPTANLISATEHTFALLLSLARSLPAADASMKTATWDRKTFVGTELQHKTLGVVGFGRIGQQVARRARAFDMKVLAFDPFLDAEVVRRQDCEPAELEDLLARADVVTLHTPLSEGTRNLLSAERIAGMKPGAFLINCGRGGIVDEPALLAALDAGLLAGAALDVFAEEPPTDWALARHPRVVATPHLGAQTQEAQVRISTETARMVVAALDGSLEISAVNLPFRSTGPQGEPYLHLGERLGRIAGALHPGNLKRFAVELWGVEAALRTPIAVAALKGALSHSRSEAVTFVNAERIARDSGLKVERVVHGDEADYPHLVAVTIEGDGGRTALAGTLFHDREPRVVELDGHQLEFRPQGDLLVVKNRDVPGVVGRLGTALGDAGVNIADIHLSRDRESGEAIAVLRLDAAPPRELLERVRALQEVRSAEHVALR